LSILPYFDDLPANDTVPPPIISLIPPEYLSTSKRLVKRELLIAKKADFGHDFP
jgi:hypothetical protein